MKTTVARFFSKNKKCKLKSHTVI